MERQIDRWKDSLIDGKIDRSMERQIDRKIVRQIENIDYRQLDRQRKYRHIDREKDIWKDRQIEDEKIDRQK